MELGPPRRRCSCSAAIDAAAAAQAAALHGLPYNQQRRYSSYNELATRLALNDGLFVGHGAQSEESFADDNSKLSSDEYDEEDEAPQPAPARHRMSYRSSSESTPPLQEQSAAAGAPRRRRRMRRATRRLLQWLHRTATVTGYILQGACGFFYILLVPVRSRLSIPRPPRPPSAPLSATNPLSHARTRSISYASCATCGGPPSTPPDTLSTARSA